MVSIYLESAEPATGRDKWHACVQFALVISHPTDPTTYVVNSAFLFFSFRRITTDIQCIVASHHRFTSEDRTSGFKQFKQLREFFDTQTGHIQPIVENNQTCIAVFLRVLEDPTGTLWRKEPIRCDFSYCLIFRPSFNDILQERVNFGTGMRGNAFSWIAVLYGAFVTVSL